MSSLSVDANMLRDLTTEIPWPRGTKDFNIDLDSQLPISNISSSLLVFLPTFKEHYFETTADGFIVGQVNVFPITLF